MPDSSPATWFLEQGRARLAKWLFAVPARARKLFLNEFDRFTSLGKMRGHAQTVETGYPLAPRGCPGGLIR